MTCIHARDMRFPHACKLALNDTLHRCALVANKQYYSFMQIFLFFLHIFSNRNNKKKENVLNYSFPKILLY